MIAHGSRVADTELLYPAGRRFASVVWGDQPPAHLRAMYHATMAECMESMRECREGVRVSVYQSLRDGTLARRDFRIAGGRVVACVEE